MLLFHCTVKASDPDATPALGIQEILSAHPESHRWLTQTEVENDPKLNLQPGAIGTFYAHLRSGQQSKQKLNETTLELESKGVYRARGLQYPKRVWWLAFVEEGRAQPRFDISVSGNTFSRKQTRIRNLLHRLLIGGVR